MKAPLLLFVSFLLPFSAIAAKHAPKATKKKAEASANLDEYYKDVAVYPGATKVPVLAREAIILDYNSNRILLEKHANDRMVPSSMTKMMTSYLIIDKVRKGELNLDTSFTVSEKAWRLQGSKMFVPLGAQVKVSDLLRGIIVQSGNDACVVAAEGISGGESQFAAEMNAKAAALGMTGTMFKNASGWPEADHYSTARDLAILGAAVVRDHPDFYTWYKEKDYSYNGIKQGNRNPLLYDNINCDGIKTGHTDEGGYGVAASCLDGSQRYILVVNGLTTMQARADEARKLMAWARENFVKKVVAKQGDVLSKTAALKLGVKDTIPAIASRDVELLVLRNEQGKVQSKVILNEGLEAPIKKGDRVGKVVVTSPAGTVESPLVAGESVEKLGFFKRALRYIGIDA